MSKFIKATVNRPIGGYGYFKGDEGSFPEDQVNDLSNKGYITITEKPQTPDKAKEEAKKAAEKKAKDETDKKAKEEAEAKKAAEDKAKEEAKSK